MRYVYRLLEDPRVYEFVQMLLGGRRVFRAVRESLSVELAHIRYGNVLEVGCGTGLTKDCFSGDYTGVDINPEYIRMGSGKGGGTFLVADATSLPFETASYDLVVTVGVLHHLDEHERRKMFGEMQRVCRPGGHILIADGLVPSSRMNLLGYIMAKLDRGRYKMRIEGFQGMVREAYPGPFSVKFERYNVFPLEFVVAVVGNG